MRIQVRDKYYEVDLSDIKQLYKFSKKIKEVTSTQIIGLPAHLIRLCRAVAKEIRNSKSLKLFENIPLWDLKILLGIKSRTLFRILKERKKYGFWSRANLSLHPMVQYPSIEDAVTNMICFVESFLDSKHFFRYKQISPRLEEKIRKLQERIRELDSYLKEALRRCSQSELSKD